MNLFQDGDPRVRVEIRPIDVDKQNSEEDSVVNSIVDQNITPTEINSVQNFLSGKNCLHGVSIYRLFINRNIIIISNNKQGNGWWKYEFCFGRSIVQYHTEKDGTKTTVNLGKFDIQKHLEWIAIHPYKKPGPREIRKHLSHFYSDGTICEKIGQLRQTEVLDFKI